MTTTKPIPTNIEDISLKFTPYARAKLQFICDHYDHEVGAMGIAATADPFLVTDLFVPKQECSDAFVAMDANDLADSMFMVYCDPSGPHKLKPHQVGRIFIHTHPKGCNSPSLHDENIFAESFGSQPWAMMVILPKGGPLYSRIRIAIGNDINLQLMIKDSLVLDGDFPAANRAEWQKEVDSKITVKVFPTVLDLSKSGAKGTYKLPSGYWKKPKKPKQRKSIKEEEAEVESLFITHPSEELPGAPFWSSDQANDTAVDTQTNGVPDKCVTELWPEASLGWVPPCTFERINYLQEYGFHQSIDPETHKEHYTLVRGDTVYDLNFKQAWAMIDYEENIEDERDDFECAMYSLTSQRKYGDAIVTGDTLANVYKKVRADCLWMIQGSDDTSDALVLTREENALAEKVVSGELSADQALMQVPDVVDEQEAVDNNGVFLEYCGDTPVVLTEEEQMILGGES